MIRCFILTITSYGVSMTNTYRLMRVLVRVLVLVQGSDRGPGFRQVLGQLLGPIASWHL